MILKLLNRKNDQQAIILIKGELALSGSLILDKCPDGETKQVLYYNSSSDTWSDLQGNEWTEIRMCLGVPEEAIKKWARHCIIDVQGDFSKIEREASERVLKHMQDLFSVPSKEVLSDADTYSAFVKPEHICKGCGADLSLSHSIIRKYINKDDNPSKFGTGHYDENGDYEPDQSVNLTDGRYDTVDGCDTCSNCRGIVG